jgi:hypothetical protein
MQTETYHSSGWAAFCAAAIVVAGCNWTNEAYWKLVDSGYSLEGGAGSNEFAIEVHENKVFDLGGDTGTPQFHQFVADRLKERGLCPRGWERMPCTDVRSCGYRTHYSVMVVGRCLAP